MAQSTAALTRREIVRLAIPAFGQLVADPLFVLIDTAIVGHLGDSALAGLSLGSTIVLTAVGLCIFLAYSTTSQVSKLLGAGRTKEGMQAGINGLWLAAMIGIALTAVILSCAQPLCVALGANGETVKPAVTYTQCVVLGVTGMLLSYAATGILRGMQHIKTTLYVAVAAAVLNTVLDVLFIYGFGWGVAGSGIATCIAQWAMGIYMTVIALNYARKNGVSLRPHIRGILGSASDGLPLFIRTLALRIAMIATVAITASMGTHVLASYQATNSVWNFSANALDAVSIAGQTLVAAQIGANQRKKAHDVMVDTGVIGAIFGVFLAAIMLCIAAFGTGLFTTASLTARFMRISLVIVALSFPLQGLAFALEGVLLGAGDFIYLSITCTISAASYIGVLYAMGWFYEKYSVPAYAKVLSIWIAFCFVYLGLRALANVWRAHSNAWIDKAIADLHRSSAAQQS